MVELGSIPNLKQMGMERDSISVGDRVTVVANPDRDPDNHYLFFNSMTAGDGTRIVPDYVITAYEECDPEAAGMHLQLESR